MTDQKPLAGRRIRLVAPARWVTSAVTDAFAARAEALGAVVEADPQCFARDGQLAGDDATREAALWAALSDPSVDVVWAARGGYGSMRLLERLARRPAPKAKVFIGYSDMTAIHQHLYGSPTTSIHAAMPFDLEKPEKAENVTAALAAVAGVLGGGDVLAVEHDLTPVQPGAAKAPMIPANLSVLTALLGTPYEPRWESAILCLEDVDEYLYAVDRMFWRLAASRLGPRIKGILLGEFSGTQDNAVPWGRSVAEIAAERFPTIPIASGMPVGHGARNAPVVVGRIVGLTVGDTAVKLTYSPGRSA